MHSKFVHYISLYLGGSNLFVELPLRAEHVVVLDELRLRERRFLKSESRFPERIQGQSIKGEAQIQEFQAAP